MKLLTLIPFLLSMGACQVISEKVGPISASDVETRDLSAAETKRHVPTECCAPNPICMTDSDCGSGYCNNGICIPEGPALESGSPPDPACHNDAQCEGGYCYNGICVADPPALTRSMRVARQAPDPRCHNNAECQGGYCLNGICLADPPHAPSTDQIGFTPYGCHQDSDCTQSDRKFCVRGFCVKSPPRLLESRSPAAPSCRYDSQCEGGYCYNGICIADLPPPTRFVRVARQAPDPRCHNDAECQGGYCYNDICIADPPPLIGSMQAVRQAPDPRCHNNAECQGGYCLNGICLADPPHLQ